VATKGFSVFIAADIEGTTGYVNWPDQPPEAPRAQEQMTAEVNAAIEGAREGGAHEIIVSDIHWTKQNINAGALSGGASLIRGSRRKRLWMDFVERCDLVLLIGFHSRFGMADAVLPHTMDPRILKLKINGQDAGEALISALTAGCFGVPVGMAAGDRAFIEESKTFLPLIETVAVKEARGNFAALNLHPARSAELIRAAARAAVEKGLQGVFKPLRFKEPVRLDLELIWPGYADALNLVPGVQRRGGREISFTGGWLEALELISLFVNWIRVVPGIFDKFK
jgi:D-amino peptidase